MAERFHAPFLAAEVELTGERTAHIHVAHPDGAEVVQRLAATLRAPEVVMRDRLTSELLVARTFDFVRGLRAGPKVCGRYRCARRARERDVRAILGGDRLQLAASESRGSEMANHMRLRYDTAGDILYIDFVDGYKEQNSDMIGDTVIARTNPQSGRVESMEILSFMRTLRGGARLDLPIDPALMPLWEEIEAATVPVDERHSRVS